MKVVLERVSEVKRNSTMNNVVEHMTRIYDSIDEDEIKAITETIIDKYDYFAGKFKRMDVDNLAISMVEVAHNEWIKYNANRMKTEAENGHFIQFLPMMVMGWKEVAKVLDIVVPAVEDLTNTAVDVYNIRIAYEEQVDVFQNDRVNLSNIASVEEYLKGIENDPYGISQYLKDVKCLHTTAVSVVEAHAK